ncbi:Diphthine--ammonia ligase [Escovopsis weberi]|uniref:Diphthine--ammonia ligase n=1 Tax=Escovopsis weberi TaxID=150374 RepID=A0A0M8N2N4_ESCWE|nr:Diphthine--ammonia ligase [Escovopsis weberi]
MASASLNVIALISGGKDSFFNQLHCIQHGHRIVALANLFPDADGSQDAGVQFIDPLRSIPHERDAAARRGPGEGKNEEEEEAEEADLNSFMYQTVGHEVVPLYAGATGIPLYRKAIRGGAVHHERDYAYAAAHGEGPDGDEEKEEETESMIPLLRFIMARHPEANALCSGAILSTYQRTRVESVALRLGLTPLAYLWKYTLLPPPAGAAADEAQLLLDMAAAGLEARIIKVASAGLDERHLWERVSGAAAAARVKGALGRFGAAEGAVLGEGGEFETLVVDGPGRLFRRRIEVPEGGKTVVQEGGGSNWLMMRGARLEDKQREAEEEEEGVRVPGLWDPAFEAILDGLRTDPPSAQIDTRRDTASAMMDGVSRVSGASTGVSRWCVLAGPGDPRESIEAETRSVVAKIRALLSAASLDAAQITTALIVLRRMADFPKVNVEYGRLFAAPNPPSRITISCGDLLPRGHGIMVCVTAQAAAAGERDGLHVQSRSYWAPANIGPYSQAIDVGVTTGGRETAAAAAGGVRAVYVAGQIPLVPASMTLPGGGTETQVALSLQHLWRIGAEMKVQLWTSAVAYFARSPEEEEEEEEGIYMQRNARLADRAWRLAHLHSRGREDEDEGDEEEEEEGGPDLWDLRFNPQYRSLAQAVQQRQERKYLPDWSVLRTRGRDGAADEEVPPVFAAEVEELPRQSAVEWHAHVGVSRIGEGDAEIIGQEALSVRGWRAWSVLVRSERAVLVYTTLAKEGVEAEAEAEAGGHVKADLAAAYSDSLRRLGVLPGGAALPTPYLVYVDAGAGEGMAPWMEEAGVEGITGRQRAESVASDPLALHTTNTHGTMDSRVAPDETTGIFSQGPGQSYLALSKTTSSRRGATAAAAKLKAHVREQEEEEEEEGGGKATPSSSVRKRRLKHDDEDVRGGGNGNANGGRGGHDDDEDDDEDTMNEERPSWLRRGVARFQSLELENKGSVARDHLALERTFLAWLRTSLAFASIGVAVTQLFRLDTSSGGSTSGSTSSVDVEGNRLRQMGRPLGTAFLAISILTLLLGCKRYYRAQEWILRGKFPASRGTILVMAFIALALMVLALVVIVAIHPPG